PPDFKSYGWRRGNPEVMVRGTFANVRLNNLLAPGTEGPVTVHLPDGEQMTIYDASVKYQAEGVPLLVIAGKEYGSGSSRDWAARSEEHTSELQSRGHVVCRLLLEKKKAE